MKTVVIIFCVVTATAITGCAQNRAQQQAQEQIRQGDRAAGNTSLTQAIKDEPSNEFLIAQRLQNQNRLLSGLWVDFDQTILSNNLPAAQNILDQVSAIDPRNSRLAAAQRTLELAKTAASTSTKVRQTTPSNALRLTSKRIPALEFRDAPLRSVVDAMGRLGGINFVFDREVRTDLRVTVALKDVSVEEALQVILLSQQLAFKALNENAILVYPNTAAKLRDYLELESRSFFLNNLDAKQAQALIKAIVKTKDTFIDEKMNVLIIKDTPAAISLAERLLESADYAEPEVILDVVVLEIARGKAQELGIRYPSQVQYGLPSSAGTSINKENWRDQIATIVSPSVVANLKSNLSKSDLLSNPNLRVKNREKARIHIGEKLPVFTSSFTTGTNTTGGTANAFATQISFLDVGLKLDVEPQIFLQNEVGIKLALEVSNVIEKVQGPAESVGYRIGTRIATTNLRLRDGETQVIGGLIRDDERGSNLGIPGLSQLPMLGRLFGNTVDETERTEIVLLITPRIVRNIAPVTAATERFKSGTETSIGTAPIALANRSTISLSGSNAPGAAVTPARASSAPVATPAAAESLTIALSGPNRVNIGAEFEVVLTANSATVEQGLIAEITLVGDSVLALDGSRGPVLVPIIGEQTRLKLKAGAVSRAASATITAVRAPSGLVTLDPPATALNIQVGAP